MNVPNAKIQDLKYELKRNPIIGRKKCQCLHQFYLTLSFAKGLYMV